MRLVALDRRRVVLGRKLARQPFCGAQQVGVARGLDRFGQTQQRVVYLNIKQRPRTVEPHGRFRVFAQREQRGGERRLRAELAADGLDCRRGNGHDGHDLLLGVAVHGAFVRTAGHARQAQAELRLRRIELVARQEQRARGVHRALLGNAGGGRLQ